VKRDIFHKRSSDVDAAGKRFGWFLDGFDKKSELLIYHRRVFMDTAAISRLVGEDAMDGYAVLPEWRSEIEANVDGPDPVDWEAHDYFIGSAQLGGVTETADVQRYPWFAPP
jgi:hypothetical protein